MRASALCQAYPTFYSDYKAKSLFISVSEKFYEKFIVIEDYCVFNHSSIFPVENCKFHLVLIGSSLDQILQRLDKYHFTYQIVDCIYTLYKNSFYSNVLSSRGALEHKLKSRIPAKLPSVANTHLLRTKLKRHVLLRSLRPLKIEKICSAEKTVLLRSLRPLRLLDQLFWKGSKSSKLKV